MIASSESGKAAVGANDHDSGSMASWRGALVNHHLTTRPSEFPVLESRSRLLDTRPSVANVKRTQVNAVAMLAQQKGACTVSGGGPHGS